MSASVLAAASTGRWTAWLGVVLVVGYLLGSVPSAVWVARRRAVDIRAVGDRNPGFWNAKETLGAGAALPVFLADAAKGAAAAALGLVALHQVGGGRWWLPYAAGLAAMVGHAWPAFARLRGGRCVLTFLGAWVVINPVELLVSLALCLLLYAVLRRFSPAARIGVLSLPVVQAFTDPRSHVAMTGVLMTLIGLRFGQAALADRRAAAAAAARPGAP